MSADPFRRPPMVDFDHPDGQSLFWRISHALDRLVEQLEKHSPADLFFQKVAPDIAEAEEADMSRYVPDVKVHHTAGCELCGRTDAHTHTQSDHQAQLGGDGHGGGVFDAPPAAEPYVPPKARWTPAPSDDEPREGDMARRDDADLADAERRARDIRDLDQDPGAVRVDSLEAAKRIYDDSQNKPPGDIHDLRRGRWYDKKPIKSTNTGSAGGTGMSGSIEEVRAGIMAANEKLNEGLGAAQQAHAALEEGQGMLMQATQGSGQGDVSTATGLLAQALNDLDQARQEVSAAISESEGVANRL